MSDSPFTVVAKALANSYEMKNSGLDTYAMLTVADHVTQEVLRAGGFSEAPAIPPMVAWVLTDKESMDTMREGRSIPAVRRIRDQFNLGLREAVQVLRHDAVYMSTRGHRYEG